MMQPKDYSSFGCIIINLLILPPNIVQLLFVQINIIIFGGIYIIYSSKKCHQKEIYIHNKKFFISVLSIYLPDFHYLCNHLITKILNNKK